MKNWRLFSPAPLELVSRCLDFFFFSLLAFSRDSRFETASFWVWGFVGVFFRRRGFVRLGLVLSSTLSRVYSLD